MNSTVRGMVSAAVADIFSALTGEGDAGDGGFFAFVWCYVAYIYVRRKDDNNCNAREK